MNPAIILQSLHETISLWETELDRYTLEQLCCKPAKDSWSLGQVYMHLLDNTLYYNFPEIEKCISSDENISGKKSEEAKIIFANNEFPDERIKTPPDDESPDQPKSIGQLQGRWKEVNNKLALLEQKITTSQYKGKTKHPGLYYFDAWEWLQFVDIHFRHHLRQKERIDRFLKTMNPDQ